MPKGLLVTRDLLIDRTRTRTTGLRTTTEGPKQLLVNRRPADGRDKDKDDRAKDKHTGSNAVPGKQATADGPDKDGDMVGGGIWRGNQRKSGSGDMLEGAIGVTGNQATC